MRYLYYHFLARTGLLHTYSDLRTLCREAAWLGRIPVFPYIAPFTSEHNFGKPRWLPLSRYVNTKNIVYYRPDKNAEPLQIALDSISDTQLQMLDIPSSEILDIALEKPITAAQNRRFALISCNMHRRNPSDRLRGPLLAEACAHAPAPTQDLSQSSADEFLRVILHPSAEVRRLAAEITRQLPQNYCAVHVRRGDYLRSPAIWTYSSPQAVNRALERISFPAMSSYLMSNERSPFWLRRIRKQRPIFHYTDFPQLAELTQKTDLLDNYFLFAVEREIMKNTATQLLPYHSRKFLGDSFFPDDALSKRIEALYPSRIAATVFERKHYYHQSECAIAISAMLCGKVLYTPHFFLKRIIKLIKVVIGRTAKAVLYYAVIRLFAPGSLQRYRNRRKALNLA